MKYFIVVLIVLSFYTCRQKATQEEIKEKVYSIYLPEFADDSIQVYSTLYESDIVYMVLKYYKFESIINLKEEDIIRGERLLETKLLDAFIERDNRAGKPFSVSGEEYFAYFSKKPLREYKRQYMGFADKKNRRYIFVTLWNMDLSDKDSEKIFNDKIFAPLTVVDIGTFRMLFIIDLKQKTIKVV
jgi:hypothetical protein